MIISNFHNRVARILIITVVLMTIIGSSFNSGIYAGEMEQRNTIVINEFEQLKSLNEELRDKENGSKMLSSISEEEEKLIRNYRKVYSDHIKELNSWTDEELAFVGYEPSQIYAIRNFDGSDEMMALAATKVKVITGFQNKRYTSDGGTRIDLISSFNCKGIAVSGFDDIFVSTWSAPLSMKSKKGYLEYRTKEYLNASEHTKTVKANGLYGAEMLFKCSKSYEQGSGKAPIYKYLYAGSIILELSSNTKVKDFQAFASYGHTSINIGGVSASIMPGASVTFSVGTSTAGSAYAYL